MSTPSFPSMGSAPWLGFPGVEWNVTKSAQWGTGEQSTRTGRRAAIVYQARPIWHFKFTFAVIRDQSDAAHLARNVARTAPYSEFQTLVSFCLGRYGKGLPFFITDPFDNLVTAQTIMASTTAGTTDFQMVRSFGNGGFVEPVGGINTGAANVVRIDGTPTTAYTANLPYDGWIRFTGAAATTLATGSHVITADFSYYFKVAFEKDALDFHTSMIDRWEAKSVNMRSVWP